jgi:hypothetical protein
MGLGSEIRDRENTYSGQKNHWIPDPDPQHCYYRELILKKKSCGSGIFSRIRIVPIPDLGSTSKNLSIQTQTIVFKLSEICSWLFIPDLDHDFYPSRFRIRKIDKNYLNSLIRIRDPGSMIVI